MKINCTKTVYSILSKTYKDADTSLSLNVDDTNLQKEENPVYLFVQLDNKLNLKRKSENLKKKGTEEAQFN